MEGETGRWKIVEMKNEKKYQNRRTEPASPYTQRSQKKFFAELVVHKQPEDKIRRKKTLRRKKKRIGGKKMI